MGGWCCKSFSAEHHPETVDFQSISDVGSTKTPSRISFEDPDETEGNIYIEERCFICLEDYNDQENQPRILPCGHIICHQCLKVLAKPSSFTNVKCPQDRQTFKLKQRRGNRAATPLFAVEIDESRNADNSVPDVGSLMHSGTNVTRNPLFTNDSLEETSESEAASFESLTLPPELLSRDLQNCDNDSDVTNMPTRSKNSSSVVVSQHPPFMRRICYLPDENTSYLEPPPDYPNSDEES